MRTLSLIVLLVSVAACGPRVATVRTAPQVASATSVEVANTLNVPINVYVVMPSRQLFLGQVSSNSTLQMPVAGFPVGAIVTVRAILADGTRQYEKAGFVLNTKSEWRVP